MNRKVKFDANLKCASRAQALAGAVSPSSWPPCPCGTDTFAKIVALIHTVYFRLLQSEKPESFSRTRWFSRADCIPRPTSHPCPCSAHNTMRKARQPRSDTSCADWPPVVSDNIRKRDGSTNHKIEARSDMSDSGLDPAIDKGGKTS